MPIHIEQLDSSEDNVTLLLGRNILLKIVEDQASKSLLKSPLVEELIAVKGLCNTKTVKSIEDLLAADNVWPE
jgi:hypothetical protein